MQDAACRRLRRSPTGGRWSRSGFTLVEMVTSLGILAVAVVGLSTTTARLVRVAAQAETRGLALQAVEDRISRVRLHPVYQELDSLFSESDGAVSTLPGFSRTTDLKRVILPGDREGKYIDYTQVTVTVEGPGLDAPISRTVAVGVS